MMSAHPARCHRIDSFGQGVGVVPSRLDGDVHSSFALLLRARDGDKDACNELVPRYLPRLRRWAHGRLPDWARQHLDTEDIVQDTLMQSVRQLPDFTPEHERAFCAYVSQALRNRLARCRATCADSPVRDNRCRRRSQPAIRLRSSRPSACRC